MHSVVVYGDYRQHFYLQRDHDLRGGVSSEARINGAIHGGVFLMAEAIRRMLDPLPFVPDHPRPQLFTFDVPTPDMAGAQTYRWAVRSSRLMDPLEGCGGDRWRLFQERRRANPKKRQVAPRLSAKLVRALGPVPEPNPAPADGDVAPESQELPVGLFDPPGKGVADFCPDIVVFDDLDGSLRRASCPAGDNLASDAVAFGYPAGITSQHISERYTLGLSLLLNRVSRAASPPLQGDRGPATLEPVVVCSVSGKPPRPKDRTSDRFWGRLARSPHLRRRTVVLLDAADLREFGHLAISSGLSWERTALDAAAELRRSPRLRWLLRFAEVVIRFGSTGALHISRRADRQWVYRLCYDPRRSDAEWDEPVRDGVVLGASSLFASAVVRRLTEVCLERREKPVLLDLSEAVWSGLATALGSCQRLINLGYGTVGGDNGVLDTDDADDTGGPGHGPLLDDLAQYDAGVFLPQYAPPLPGPFAEVMLPPLPVADWTILGTTAGGRVGAVARDIVQDGVTAALLQVVPGVGEFADRLADGVADAAEALAGDDLFDWDPGEFEERRDETAEDLLLEAGHLASELVRLPAVAREQFRRRLGRRLGGLSRAPESVATALTTLWQFRNRPYSDLLDTDEEVALRALRHQLGRDLRRELDLPLADHPLAIPVAAPVYRVGGRDPKKQLYLVDRQEIESVRHIKQLVTAHLNRVRDLDPKDVPPLSIAVFGPPGAGKSLSVRRVVDSIDHEVKTKLLSPYNLAQFSGSHDLDQAFTEVSEMCAQRKVPVAFFDEFDSRLGEEEWGWLKFFLSPMEDGRHRGRSVFTSVFVFAGGTSPTYAAFSQRDRPTTDPQVQDFSRAKGPDFVSRLKAHLDVVGVNPTGSGDTLYLIRRAVVLRSLLAEAQTLSDGQQARIDSDVLRAMLFVPSYKNGARSIRNLIAMCSGAAGRLANGGLPPVNQLNMVTDGQAFLDLLADVSAGRVRR